MYIYGKAAEDTSSGYWQGTEDNWVTVFGFQPGDTPAVLREFSKCGDIIHFGSGREDAVNWVHIHFAVSAGCRPCS